MGSFGFLACNLGRLQKALQGRRCRVVLKAGDESVCMSSRRFIAIFNRPCRRGCSVLSDQLTRASACMAPLDNWLQ